MAQYEPTDEQVEAVKNELGDGYNFCHVVNVEKWAGRLYVEGHGSLAGVHQVAEKNGLELAKQDGDVACFRSE